MNLRLPIDHFKPMGGTPSSASLSVRGAGGSRNLIIDGMTGAGLHAGGPHGFTNRRFIIELSQDEAVELRRQLDLFIDA